MGCRNSFLRIGVRAMKKAMVRVNWNKSQLKNDINPVLEKYENYLRYSGFRESSIIHNSI